MEAVYSPLTMKVYFKNDNVLHEAPFDKDTKVVDFSEASVVDWFLLTSEEMEDAFMVLQIMEEQDEIQ